MLPFNPSEVIVPDSWDDLAAAWREAKLPGWDKKLERTTNRCFQFQQRQLDEGWRMRWREAIRVAGQSRKCRGEGTWPGGLRMDTFLEKPDMLVKILEGNYTDGAAPSDLPPARVLTIQEEKVLSREKQARAKAKTPQEGGA